jgi:putative flippase GtrA
MVAALDFTLFTLLTLGASLYYLLANTISYTTGAIVMFFIQKNWTFQYRGERASWVFAKYLSLLVFSFIMSNIVLFTLVGFLSMNPVLSKGIQIVLGALWGFAISKVFVYR